MIPNSTNGHSRETNTSNCRHKRGKNRNTTHQTKSRTFWWNLPILLLFQVISCSGDVPPRCFDLLDDLNPYCFLIRSLSLKASVQFFPPHTWYIAAEKSMSKNVHLSLQGFPFPYWMTQVISSSIPLWLLTNPHFLSNGFLIQLEKWHLRFYRIYTMITNQTSHRSLC